MADVMTWLSTRLASRTNMTMPEVRVRRSYDNPMRRELVAVTNQSAPEVRAVTNDGEKPIPAGWLVQYADNRIGRVNAEIAPGDTGQAVVETAPTIPAGASVTLPDGRTGVAVQHIDPGTSGQVAVEVGDVLVAGTVVTLPNGKTATVVSDIAPGASGEVEYVAQGPAKSIGVCGVVLVGDDGSRFSFDIPIASLAAHLEPALPATLDETQPLTAEQYDTLLAHARTVSDLLERSVELWRSEGLI